MSVYSMSSFAIVEQAKDERWDEPLVAKRRFVVCKRRLAGRGTILRGKMLSYPM
jgi:hypothetical protein